MTMLLHFYFDTSALVSNQEFWVESVHLNIKNLDHKQKTYIKDAVASKKCPSDLYAFLVFSVINANLDCPLDFVSMEFAGKEDLIYFGFEPLDEKSIKEYFKSNEDIFVDTDFEIITVDYKNQIKNIMA